MKSKATGVITPRFGEIQIFGITPSPAQSMTCEKYDGAQWLPLKGDGWQPLGGAFVSAPALILFEWDLFDTINVFGIGLDLQMYYAQLSGDWPPPLQNWVPLGGAFNSLPVVSQGPPGPSDPSVGFGPSSLIDIVALGTNNALYHKTLQRDRSPEFSEGWDNLGGVFLFEPAAVGMNFNTLDIFGIGTDGHMYQKSLGSVRPPASESGWNDLGGCFISAPAAVSWGPNRIDVFGLGSNSHMYHKAFDVVAGGWQADWEDLGGIFDSAPAVVSWGPNRLDIFGLGSDNHMYHKWWDGNTWGPSQLNWDGLGGTFDSAPAVTSKGSNRLDIFGLGTDNKMYHKWWDGNAWGPSHLNWEQRGSVVFGVPKATKLPALPASRQFSDTFTWPGNVALDGSVTVTLNQDGTGTWAGSFHDSGAAPYSVGIAGVLRAKNLALGFKSNVSVSGTFEPGSRDQSWSTPFKNAAIAENWANIGLGCVEAEFAANESVEAGLVLLNLFPGPFIDVIS